MVRGLHPFLTAKFDIANHPRYAELGEQWRPSEGQTDRDNPYIYILKDNMFTLPETEYIELGDFIDTGIADDSNIVEVRCVFSEESEVIRGHGRRAYGGYSLRNTGKIQKLHILKIE